MRQLRILSVADCGLEPGEIGVDLFAGGGGWSEGFQWATGVPPAVAVNHDEHAIAMHTANHPETEHHHEDVFEVDPLAATRGRAVGWLHLSPDCTHFSKAKGGKPRSQKIRGLAWVAITWAEAVRPRIVSLENVAEFVTWGPLDEHGNPIKARAGETFHEFTGKLESLGYEVQWRVLNAADFGAPTSRKRLFLIARRDGRRIEWPHATHGKHGQQPYRTAAECIDWSIPVPSIFERSKPLAEATQRRIAEGIRRYVLQAKRPFLVNLTHGVRIESVDEPFRTLTAAHRGEKALVVAAFVAKHFGGVVGQSLEKLLGTVTARDHHSLVTAEVVRFGGGNEFTSRCARCGGSRDSVGGREGARVPSEGGPRPDTHRAAADREACEERLPDGSRLAGWSAVPGAGASAGVDGPARRDTSRDGHQPQGRRSCEQRSVESGSGDEVRESSTRIPRVESPAEPHDSETNPCQCGATGESVAGHRNVLREDCEGTGRVTDDSLSRGQLVAALLCKYYGNDQHGQGLDEPLHTVPTKDRFGLVTVVIGGEEFVIADIGMRMLAPRELARAQGFPDTYVLTGTKTQQVARIGNSVCPHVARAIVEANLMQAGERAA